jgi:cell division protein FtsX
VKQYNRTLIISVIAICAILIGVAASTFVPVSTNTKIGNFPVSMGITLKNDAIQNAVQSLEVIATEIKKTKTQNIQLTPTQVDRLVQLLQDNLNELRLIRTSINAVADNIESGKDRKNTQQND